MNKSNALIIFIFANIRKSNSMSLASIREKKFQAANNVIVIADTSKATWLYYYYW